MTDFAQTPTSSVKIDKQAGNMAIRVDGPTESGGAYAISCVNADEGWIEVTEYDQNDRVILCTYGWVKPQTTVKSKCMIPGVQIGHLKRCKLARHPLRGSGGVVGRPLPAPWRRSEAGPIDWDV